jgi:hypothetical protein
MAPLTKAVAWSPIVGMRVSRVTAGMRQGLHTERRGFDEAVPWFRVRCGYVISVWVVFGRCFLFRSIRTTVLVEMALIFYRLSVSSVLKASCLLLATAIVLIVLGFTTS